MKGYITYLKTHEKHLKAIQIDRGREFINEDLKIWCQREGIEIQITAPYSPSQNGVAEWMNRTLVGLARTMIGDFLNLFGNTQLHILPTSEIVHTQIPWMIRHLMK